MEKNIQKSKEDHLKTNTKPWLLGSQNNVQEFR